MCPLRSRGRTVPCLFQLPVVASDPRCALASSRSLPLSHMALSSSPVPVHLVLPVRTPVVLVRAAMTKYHRRVARTQQDLASRVLEGGPGPGKRPPVGCRCQFLAAAWCGGQAAPGSQASAYEGTNLTREGSTLMPRSPPEGPRGLGLGGHDLQPATPVTVD